MGSVTTRIDRAKGGRPSAFAGLVCRFYSRQVRQAGRRLRGAPGGVDGAEDVANLAFWELWRAFDRGGSLCRFVSDTATLLRALSYLTRQQAWRSRRGATRLCRDAGQTVQLSGVAPGEGAELHELARDPWPTFFEALGSREALERLIDTLTEERQRALVRLKLEGLSLADIAAEMGCSARTVQRLYAEVEHHWRSHSLAIDLLAPG